MHGPLRGLPSMVKGAALRSLSRRGSQVQILAHASLYYGLAVLAAIPFTDRPPTFIGPVSAALGGKLAPQR